MVKYQQFKDIQESNLQTNQLNIPQFKRRVQGFGEIRMGLKFL